MPQINEELKFSSINKLSFLWSCTSMSAPLYVKSLKNNGASELKSRFDSINKPMFTCFLPVLSSILNLVFNGNQTFSPLKNDSIGIPHLSKPCNNKYCNFTGKPLTPKYIIPFNMYSYSC